MATKKVKKRKTRIRRMTRTLYDDCKLLIERKLPGGGTPKVTDVANSLGISTSVVSKVRNSSGYEDYVEKYMGSHPRTPDQIQMELEDVINSETDDINAEQLNEMNSGTAFDALCGLYLDAVREGKLILLDQLEANGFVHPDLAAFIRKVFIVRDEEFVDDLYEIPNQRLDRAIKKLINEYDFSAKRREKQ